MKAYSVSMRRLVHEDYVVIVQAGSASEAEEIAWMDADNGAHNLEEADRQIVDIEIFDIEEYVDE